MSERDPWLGIEEAGRTDRGNDLRKRPATLLAQVKTIKQRCLREERGHHENGAPTHQQREDGKTRADPQLLTYYGHRQPGLVETAVIPSQALEPWSPEQPDGREMPHLRQSPVCPQH